ncbi:hypothetical protein BD311DRAFT_144250 [Dichomitus squalens]|uniref:C2H2-type domain-containing protein n=1 Tax=Dichomitus squalens TaxID=114155 RepID=A0A4Q9M7N3_9APHY|nr:hypothetical protein BD311DRAFT_144250 [Dichomitus squalens]
MFSTYHDESTAITSFMPLDPMAIIHHHVTEDAPLNGVSQHGLTNFWPYGDTSPIVPLSFHDLPAPTPHPIPYVSGHYGSWLPDLISITQETSPTPSSHESAGLQPTEGRLPWPIEADAQLFRILPFDKFPILTISATSLPLSANFPELLSLCTVLVDPNTLVKSFECILCGRLIKTRTSNLRDHLATHDRGRTRFVCAWQGSCGRNYSKRSDCKGHIERDHLMTRPKRGIAKHRTTQPDGSRATRRAVHV